MLPHRMICFFALLSCVLVNPGRTNAADPFTVRLWDGDAPNATGSEPKDVPTAIIYLPETQKEMVPALVILPGGGYGGLAIDHEGHQIARWANGMGMAGIIVQYRHRGRGYGFPNPMVDAERAIRMTRHRAAEWKIDPKRVGLIGFSAGGHLCSSVLTHFDLGISNATDPIDRQSSRPDYGILCYPVIALGESFTHVGSQKNLLGESPAPELVRSMSNEKQVSAMTPPTFLWHTAEDKVVAAENSLRFYSSMVTAGVPGELHVFPIGRHGLGLAANDVGASQWPELCKNWLKQIGMRD